MGLLKKAEDRGPCILGDLADEPVAEMLEVGKGPQWAGRVWNFNLYLWIGD